MTWSELSAGGRTRGPLKSLLLVNQLVAKTGANNL